MASTYDQSGNWTVIASLIVSILAHFSINTTTTDVLTVIGAVGIIVGVVKQYIAHKKLALSAGVVIK